MADSSESRPVARATKPVSEALLNEKVRVYPGESVIHRIQLWFSPVVDGRQLQLMGLNPSATIG